MRRYQLWNFDHLHKDTNGAETPLECHISFADTEVKFMDLQIPYLLVSVTILPDNMHILRSAIILLAFEALQDWR